jgi:hypothetical protein
MLLCDAWFDVVTSGAPGDRMEAVVQAALGELPLSAICWYIVYDAERFRSATIVRYSNAVRRLRGGAD